MAALALERGGNGCRLQLNGDWSLAAMARIDHELRTLTTPIDAAMVCDWSHAEAPGIGAVWALLTRLRLLNAGGFPVTHVGAPHTLAFLQRLEVERPSVQGAKVAPSPARIVGAVGRWTLSQGVEARGALGFFGRMVTVLGEIFTRPGALRAPSIVRHVYETGITAIPIVSLIAFLISVIVAYLGAQQLARFGADIFVGVSERVLAGDPGRRFSGRIYVRRISAHRARAFVGAARFRARSARSCNVRRQFTTDRIRQSLDRHCRCVRARGRCGARRDRDQYVADAECQLRTSLSRWPP
jgi:hypothetical protein